MKLLAWLSKKEYDRKKQINIISASSYFDAEWYYEQNPDVKEAGKDAAKHYLTIGWKEGRNPSADFNSNEYLRRHPELLTMDVNPLIYYLVVENGGTSKYKLSLNPKKVYFDAKWYAKKIS